MYEHLKYYDTVQVTFDKSSNITYNENDEAEGIKVSFKDLLNYDVHKLNAYGLTDNQVYFASIMPHFDDIFRKNVNN